MRYRILAVILLLFLVFPDFAVYGAQAQIEGFREAAKSERFTLLCNEEQASIALVDNVDGYIWSSCVPDGYESFQSSNDIYQASMKSLFNIEYIDIKSKRTIDAVQTNPLADNAEIRTQNIPNGIRILYDFISAGISLTLEIRLEENSLDVSIPADSIKERDNFGITKIELMPFFGAAQDGEAGYLFYPDGSGGLHYFAKRPDLNAKQYDMYVYGNDSQYEFMGSKWGAEWQVMLPVYGIKRGNHAFLAVIEKGENDVCITASPSGNMVNMNRIFPGFTFRRKYTKAVAGQVVEQGVEKEIIATDRSVKFLFLKGDDADYSGMANAYRQYILDTGRMRDTIGNSDSIPLSLDLFMGIKEEQILFDKFVRMTTFEEAESIIKSFKESGVGDMDVNLIGWSKGGYNSNPIHMPPEPALGGQKGLTQLLEYTKNQGIRLFLQDNYVEAISKNGGFSKKNDVAYEINGLPVTDYGYSYLLNPVRAWTNFINNIFRLFRKYDIDGINFELFGKVTFYDYNSKHPVKRSDTAGYWERFLEKTSKEFGNAAAQGGNQYVLKNVNRLYQIPYKDNGGFITDKAVPFYQMVVHGSIPYSSDPGNTSDDLDRLKLKWVEYGYMPSFQLTYRKADLIKYTDYFRLFTSEYTKWIDRAAEIYREFNARIPETWSSFIIKHEEVQSNVIAVTYDNGCRIYINYNQDAVTVDGHKIKGMDYLVITREGVVK